MAVLFDFGISQEDALSEQLILDVKPNDRILSVASGGEVPLSLLSLNENIRICAVDLSENQIKLCRFKLISAIYLDFPLNGQFLGYANLAGKIRSKFYRKYIRPHLTESDTSFWDQNLQQIENGVVNAGRFEQYISKMRFIIAPFIGRKNLLQLINSKKADEQKMVFNDKIATRKSLQLLFKVAFHPAIYKKRGLQEQALIHAGKSTGERFYSKFEDFCTATPAAENYFLQYFLTGNCINPKSFPAYLQAANKQRLINNLNHLELKTGSFQDALNEKEKGHFNKIHISNLGDWLIEEDFAQVWELIKTKCNPGTHVCYRYLQKNHFQNIAKLDFDIDEELSALAQHTDRFPFYEIISVTTPKIRTTTTS
jgi:S-adenosylmethionine:diacylglycerol 3-amino-3-carboxypropyl transferase